MLELQPGDIGEVAILAQGKDGKWVPRQRWHRAGVHKFRARVAVRLLTGERKDIRRNGASPEEARDRALKAANELVAPARSKSALESGVTVAEAMAAYIDYLPTTKRSQGTIDLYSGTLRRHINGSTLAPMRLTDANDPDTLRDFLMNVDTHHGPSAARTTKSALSALFQWAVTKRVIATNQVKNVEPWRIAAEDRPAPANNAPTRDHDRAFTREELAVLLAYADQWQHSPADARTTRARKQAVDFLHLLAATGLRISEGLGLHWADVDLEAETLYIRISKTPRGVRYVALPKPLVTRLRAREQIREGELVFGAPLVPDKPWHVRNCRRTLQAVIDAAGFEWAIPHSLRRTAAGCWNPPEKGGRHARPRFTGDHAGELCRSVHRRGF